jgi:hypothetical protein
VRIRHLFFVGLFTGLGLCVAAHALSLRLAQPTEAQKQLVVSDASLLGTALNSYIRDHGAYSEDLRGSLCLYLYQLPDFSPWSAPADLSVINPRDDPAELKQLTRMETDLSSLRPYPSTSDALGPMNMNIRLWLSPERTAQFKPHPEFWIVIHGDRAPLVYVDDNGWMTPQAMNDKLKAYRTEAAAKDNQDLVRFLSDQIFYMDFVIMTNDIKPPPRH